MAGRCSPPRSPVEDATWQLKKKQREKHIKQIFNTQRNMAEQRAAQHIHRGGKYTCLAQDEDPMPDLPQDNVQWGLAAHLRHFKTSYQNTFQDPAVLLAKQKVDVAAFKQDNIDEVVADDIERYSPSLNDS